MCCVAVRQTPCQVLVCPLFCPSNFFFALILRTRDTSFRAFSFSLCVRVCVPHYQRSRIYILHAANGRMRAALNNNMPFHAAYILVNTSSLYCYSTNDSTNLLRLLIAEPNEFLKMIHEHMIHIMHRTCM